MHNTSLRRFGPPVALGLVVTGAIAGLAVLLSSAPPKGDPPEPSAAVREEPSTQPVKASPFQLAVERKSDNETANPFKTVGDPGTGGEVREAFDTTGAGRLPAGWQQWTSNGTSSFAVTADRALSPVNGLKTGGGSNITARAWVERTATDTEVGAAVFLDTIVPIEVVARARDLKGTTPTYYGVLATRGLEVQLVRVVRGAATVLGKMKSVQYFTGKWARVTLQVKGKTLGVQVFRPDTKEYLTAEGQWQPQVAWAITATDTQIPGPGFPGLNRRAQYQGTVTFDDFAAGAPTGDPTAAATPVTTADVPTVPRPVIPRHYPHIRTALLAYAGNPMGTFEDKLLRESVDLVVSNPRYLEHVNRVSPKTPQLVYSNVSNLYQELLTDWLEFADRKSCSREAAFFHAAAARPYAGDSPSSVPVVYFWSAWRGGAVLTNVTSASRGKAEGLAFGGAGESVYLGWPDRFREIDVNLTRPAGAGWSAVLEYPTAVDAAGKPTAWAVLPTLTDATAKFSRSGRFTFDPPAAWKPASVSGSLRLYFVRFRTTGGGTAPVASTVLGRDYTGAGTGTRGTVPAFDAAADRNADGYLSDAEYNTRAAGKDARFVHESRLPTEVYGQMRFGTNPSNAAMRDWALDFHKRLLQKHPLASGIFMDNSDGKPPLKPGEAVEPLGNYAADYGLALNAIWREVTPKWVLANTAGGAARAEPVIVRNPAYFEEFLIRPFVHHWGFFEDVSAQTSRRAGLTAPPPLAVLDSHPQKGQPTDPRMVMATLAYYYLIADPESTFLMFYGGFEPASPWNRHWVAATGFDVGTPTAKWSPFATGTDPSAPTLTYKLYQRPYTKALVLYKPLAHVRAAPRPATLGDETATKHDLPGPMKPLLPDGTLGAAVTSVSLRNGEGAILVKP